MRTNKKERRTVYIPGLFLSLKVHVCIGPVPAPFLFFLLLFLEQRAEALGKSVEQEGTPTCFSHSAHIYQLGAIEVKKDGAKLSP